jgi:cyanophycinase
MKRILFFLTAVLISSTTYAQTIGPEKGSLVIVGGGNVGPDIWKKFVELAGGANAVIIYVPTATDDAALSSDREIKKLQEAGAKQVITLHTRDAKVANTAAFVAPIKTATGVWFEGGRQWRLADSYLNTLTQIEFNNLLNRGGVIGGTSAGATIQGSFLLRGDTKGNLATIGDHVKGLDFMHNVAIDQHILKRNRQFDLIDVIKAYPSLLGIGLDEGTSIVVHGNNFQVLGVSYVAIYDINRINHTTKAGDTGLASNGPFYFLKNGEQFDLLQRKVLNVSGAAPNN